MDNVLSDINKDLEKRKIVNQENEEIPLFAKAEKEVILQQSM